MEVDKGALVRVLPLRFAFFDNFSVLKICSIIYHHYLLLDFKHSSEHDLACSTCKIRKDIDSDTNMVAMHWLLSIFVSIRFNDFECSDLSQGPSGPPAPAG